MSQYAPTGVVVREGDRVLCHLCGQWFRSIPAHLSAHGWTHLAYREAFGLERNQSLEGEGTRQRRAVAMRTRRLRDPHVRAGCEQGEVWLRSGELTKAAARASRGRRQPEQRRAKTLRTLAAISPAARAEGTRRQKLAKLRETARNAAAALGFADIGSLVRDRVAAGRSLAAISREAGLHKDWLCRHLSSVDAETAREIEGIAAGRRFDAPWLARIGEWGFSSVADYLHDRHVLQRRSIRAIAHEVGFGRGAVETALARHGIAKTAHATNRERCAERAARVAAEFGFATITDYLDDRRAAGMAWREIAAECGQPPSWVRRRAGLR
ncbi:MucR family transcriptional regulator [Saccharopolyspora flava]|uniref:ROS/MUCR transcriptional regulator protein n=1 Tax=Saccharopolyspora flava TaxID=95161 RepID=A0A1I6UCU0_9PSEU|nr:MucR family transcriptional regulator [Saccharopolyspora flava]SFS99198.1 ROS/MUCR transcriptional regulator protein [Saccharopolyspora flava]